MAHRKISAEEAARAREDAKHIWQGEWNRRILFLVAAYGVVALLLLVIGDTGDTGDTSGWNTPVLFLYVGGVSVAMVLSHRSWFGRLEADLERGVTEQAEGRVQVPRAVAAFFTPSLRFTVRVGNRALCAAHRPGLDFVAGANCSVDFLSGTRIVLAVRHPAAEA